MQRMERVYYWANLMLSPPMALRKAITLSTAALPQIMQVVAFLFLAGSGIISFDAGDSITEVRKLVWVL